MNCKHENWDDYFERCEDCGATLEQLTPAQQAEYRAQFEEDIE